LAEVSFLADLSRRERNGLLSFMTPTSVPAGKVLIRQGDAGREFFIIMNGTATVRRDGETIATVGPGDHFGEIAVLGNHVPRTATVTAITPMELEVLTPAELMAMLDHAPQIARRLLDGIATYYGSRTSTVER
jgi:CRP-like cAMP-binding protein